MNMLGLKPLPNSGHKLNTISMSNARLNQLFNDMFQTRKVNAYFNWTNYLKP